MLIYWRHIYTDELYDVLDIHCASEPCSSLRYSNFTAGYTLSVADKFANYSVGVFFVIAFLVSTVLNPLVFYHFLKEQSSMVIVDLLFKILAVCDFITNLYPPLFLASQMFHPEIQANVKRSWGYILSQSISCNVGCISQSATTLLAVARFIRIRSPFFKINQTVFLALFVLYAMIMTAITIAGKYFLWTANLERLGEHSRDMTILQDFCFYLNLVQCFIGVTFSILCVTSLFKLAPDTDDELAQKTYKLRKKGCITILLINMPYLASLTFALTAAITQYKHLRALMFTFLPVITSFLNPVILCSRNTGIHKRLRYWHRRMTRSILKSTETEMMRNDTVLSTMLLEKDAGKTVNNSEI